jgi:hypothetical protein
MIHLLQNHAHLGRRAEGSDGRLAPRIHILPHSFIQLAGPDLFLFSSDYPHPEGTDDPIGRFEKTFEGISEDAKEKFYCRNFQEIFAA